MSSTPENTLIEVRGLKKWFPIKGEWFPIRLDAVNDPGAGGTINQTKTHTKLTKNLQKIYREFPLIHGGF